jgi:uncharacterized integral membrane protein
MVIFRVILILIAFIVVLVLALTNAQNTATAVVFNKTYLDVPVAFVMLYAFAFGAVCVGVFTLVSEIQLRTRLHRAKKEREGLMEELRALRNSPLDLDTPPAAVPVASSSGELDTGELPDDHEGGVS